MTARWRARRFRGLSWSLISATLLILSPANLPAQQSPAQPPSAAAQPAAATAEQAVPEGEPSQISDWALAGVLWSDAHLVRRVAAAAEVAAATDAQRTRMRQLQQECDAFIEALQAFGWQRVQRQEAPAQAAAPQRGLPDPEQIGQALEQQLGDSQIEEEAESEQAETEVAPPGTLDRRVATETPPGVDDPGIDDEPDTQTQWFDLSQYRVDDYIDEAPAEARNRADAVEDGVEGAIAAGIDNAPSGFNRSGRVSPRELQTRSQTLPVTEDTIYDTDDYDPNRDYQAENPEAGREPAGAYELESGETPDYEEPPGDRLDDPRAIDDENEAVRALTEEPAQRQEDRAADQAVETTEAQAGSAQEVAEGFISPGQRLSRYTDQADKHRADARWVQFHLEANQRRWDGITEQTGPARRWMHLRAAIVQLTADAQTVRSLTDHPDLIRILERIAGT